MGWEIVVESDHCPSTYVVGSGDRDKEEVMCGELDDKPCRMDLCPLRYAV
jgi:hypothetical protein